MVMVMVIVILSVVIITITITIIVPLQHWVWNYLQYVYEYFASHPTPPTGVIILPPQTRHYEGEIPQNVHICIVWSPPKRQFKYPWPTSQKVAPPLEVPNHLPATHAAKGPAPPALDGSHVQWPKEDLLGDPETTSSSLSQQTRNQLTILFIRVY